MPTDMSNDPTAEQLEVRRKGRQRLIGAIVLVLLAVVFVPMVLDPEPRRDRVEPLLSIPPKEGAAPLPAVAKAPEPAPERAAAESPKTGPVVAETAKSEPAPPATPKVEPKAEPKAEPKPAAAKAEPKPAAPRLEGFAVQVGAFREEGKLAQARGKIAAAKLPHYTERLDSSSGELTRLRAGPFATREAAEKAAAQLKRAGLDGRVVPLP
ncbi:MAG: SPOR domain-containing protein [Burkholderiales bacterium]|nr:SPOR domain-containing protein [Burkholderiales bacterium]